MRNPRKNVRRISATISNIESLEDRRMFTVAVGAAAPNFTLPVLNSNTSYTLSKDPAKVQVIDFFATWCGPCVSEIPEVQKAADWIKSNNVSASVHVIDDEDPAVVTSFFKSHGLTIPIASDMKNDQAFINYGITGIPTTLVIAGGVVQNVHVGYAYGTDFASTLESEIQAAMSTSQNPSTPTTGGDSPVVDTVDNGFPTIDSLSVTPSMTMRNSAIVAAASGVAAGSNGPITKVLFYRDANNNGQIDPTDPLLGMDTSSAGGWSMKLRGSALPTGRQTILATAVDAKGNTSSPASATVTMVNQLPTVRLSARVSSAHKAPSRYTLTANGNDSDGHIQSINFYADSNGNGMLDSRDTLLRSVRTAGAATFSSTLISGKTSHRFFAVATDDSGAHSAPAIASIH